MSSQIDFPTQGDLASPAKDDIAIIGMASRFGKADDPKQLWDMMISGTSAFEEFPTDRLLIDGYYHPTGRSGTVSFITHFILM